jgi:hypothetical protein
MQNHELEVRQRVDRNGDPIWEVRDTVRQKTLSFYSEADVRTWLDRRFN